MNAQSETISSQTLKAQEGTSLSEAQQTDLNNDNVLTATSETKNVILPTYILKPSENEKFYPSQVYKVVKETLSKEFDDAKVDEKRIEDWYDFGDDFEDLTKELANKIKHDVKEKLTLPRYKIIVQVTIGQRKDQGVRITSRCLWDTSTDNYAAVNYQNEHVWVSALVFGLYTD